MGCRCRNKPVIDKVSGFHRSKNDPWVRFVEQQSPELLRWPMERNEYGAKFYLPDRGVYAGIISGAPEHFINERQDWEAISGTLHPMGDGAFGLRHRPFRVLHDRIQVERFTWTTASIGILANDKFRPLWKPGKPYVVGDKVISQIGPIRHEITVDRWSISDAYMIEEMPSVEGDALAVEILQSSPFVSGVPYMVGAKGGYHELKTKVIDGRYYKVVPLALLENLEFPVKVDPELGGGEECWIQRNSAISFEDCRWSTATSGGDSFNQLRVGVSRDGASAWTCARNAGKWNAIAYSGAIVTADVKWSCSQDRDGWNVNETYSFARTDWYEYSCPVIGGDAGLVKDRCKLSTLGADIGTQDYYLNTIGCTDPGTYGAWFTLQAGDIAHLNSTWGLGSTRLLNYCIEPKNMHNGNDIVPNSGDIAQLWMWLQQKGSNGGPVLRFNAEGVGFIWLVS